MTTSKTPTFTSLTLATAMLTLALPASAQRTMNRGLHATPVKAPVVIDGKLDEWDLSGTIVSCKDVGTMLETESCQTAAMWDEQGLYLSFRFRDATPMLNRIDPVTMPGNGWKSDCVQLRLDMAGFVSHIDAWYYTDGKKPAMTIHYGRHGVKDGGQAKVDRPKYPEELGAKQAFLMDEDKTGYTQEMFIPWAVVTQDGNMPPPDADLRLGLELMWGDMTGQGGTQVRGRLTDNLSDDAKTSDFFWTSVNNWGKLIRETTNDLKLPPPAWQGTAEAEPQGAAPITLTLPHESFVTLAIEDAKGNRVRSLLGGVKLAAGENTVLWDGLDDRNELLPAGDYRWVGLHRDAIDIHWLMSFYQPNPHTPWTTADGTGGWGPDHGSIVAATAGEGLVFLAGHGAEAGAGLFAINEQGEKQWEVRTAPADLLAYTDGTLYAYRVTPWSFNVGMAASGVSRFEAKTGTWLDITSPDGQPVKRLSLLSAEECTVDTTLPESEKKRWKAISGFAANASGLYLAVPGKNVVRAFDRETFTLTREYVIPGAGALFAPDAASLLVATPTGLQRLNLADGTLAVLAAGDFTAATAITAHGDRVWVAFGVPTPQVREFSATGTPVRTIGKPEGCVRNGFYDPNDGFYNPSGLAADSQGRLWVAEDNMLPKRTSVWKEGAWQRDFIGDTYYGGGGMINPLDPTMAFYGGMRFKIDLDKGTSHLVEVGHVRPEGAEAHGLTFRTKFERYVDYLNTYKGRAYLHNSAGGTHEIYRQRADGRWALCVYIALAKKLAWMDLNDDCSIQDNEVVRGGEKEDWGRTDYWGNRPSQNLDLYFAQGTFSESAPVSGQRLRVQRVTAGGTPVYDFTTFEPMAGETQNGIGLKDGSYNSGSAGERGEYFSEMRKIYPTGTDRRTFWFRGLNTGRWTPRMPAPGVVLYPYQAHGVADAPEAVGGELVCWVSDFGQRYLFTDDMLYVDQLLKDGRVPYTDWPANPQRGFRANDMAMGQESFCGFFTRLDNGRYLLTSGFTDCRVFELKGLDSLRRLEGGTVTLGAEQLARATEIREFRLSGGKRERGHIAITEAKAVTVDGQLGEWNREAPAARIVVDAERGATVMTSADATNLYVAWEVRKTTPLRNTADSWQLAFVGGDAVDLMFRQPGDKLDDGNVRQGDLRLVLAELDGALKAVLYRPISDTKMPYLFDAFEGAGRANAVRMDEVRLAPEVKTAFTRAGQGYLVEAAIPWSMLGGKPTAGAEFRVDFGVLFGGEVSGRKVERRAYWENRDTQIVADIPSEAALKPANWGVGVLK